MNLVLFSIGLWMTSYMIFLMKVRYDLKKEFGDLIK